MKPLKIVYWLATGLLSALMFFAAGNYVLKHELMVEVFGKLGFPGYLLYPLAAAKTLGVVAIVTKKSPTLKEWAYAGFFFNFLLAISAHLNAGDGQYLPACVCMVLLTVSYFLDKKLSGRTRHGD